jgi:hypothetical protein
MFHECIPDRKWRQYRQLLESKKAITDPLLQRVDAVRNKKLVDEDVAYALDLIENADHRDDIIAFLLSGAEVVTISDWLRIPLPVMEIFCELCFNTLEFRNKLEIRSYARRYAEEYAQPENADLIGSAILLGPDYMKYYFQQGGEKVEMDPREFAKSLIQQSFHLSRVARGNPINSPATKEALRWLNAASKLISGYDKVTGDGMNDDDNEAIVAIEEVKLAKPIAEFEKEMSIPAGSVAHGN